MSDYTGPDASRIQSMFARIANRYDRANQVLSGGVHHLWRRTAVKWSDVRANDRVLDCATGMGDLAIAQLRRFQNRVPTHRILIAPNVLVSRRSLPPCAIQSLPVAPFSSGLVRSSMSEPPTSLLVNFMRALIPTGAGAVTASCTAFGSDFGGGGEPAVPTALAIATPSKSTARAAAQTAMSRVVDSRRRSLIDPRSPQSSARS